MVSWANAGSYPVSVTVYDGNCIAMDFVTIVVEPELEPLNVTCQAFQNSILFMWDSIPCVSSYQIIVNTSSGTQEFMDHTETFLSVSNLDPNSKVSLSIFADSDCVCPSSLTIVDCATLTNTDDLDSRNFNFYPNPFNEIIYLDSEPSINIDYTLYDSQGVKLNSGKILNQKIELAELAVGLYFILIESDDGKIRQMEKLVKW